MVLQLSWVPQLLLPLVYLFGLPFESWPSSMISWKDLPSGGVVTIAPSADVLQSMYFVDIPSNLGMSFVTWCTLLDPSMFITILPVECQADLPVVFLTWSQQ